MHVLDTTEITQVDGGIVPAVVAVFYAAQYIGAAYTAAQIATGVGAAAGAAVVLYNYNK